MGIENLYILTLFLYHFASSIFNLDSKNNSFASIPRTMDLPLPLDCLLPLLPATVPWDLECTINNESKVSSNKLETAIATRYWNAWLFGTVPSNGFAW